MDPTNVDAAEAQEKLPPLGPGEDVYVESSDGRIFPGKRKVFSRFSVLLKNTMEDCSTAKVYPIPNVTGEVFEKVLQYFNKHADDPVEANEEPKNPKEKTEKPKEEDEKPEKPKEKTEKPKEGDEKPKKPKEISDWDVKFLEEVDMPMLLDIQMAANYLDSEELLDLTCLRVANMMKGQTADQMRELFRIEYDFNEEEEEAIRRENAI